MHKKYTEKDKFGLFYVERVWKRGQGGRKEDVPSLHFPVFYNEKTKEIFIDSEIDNTENLIKIIPYQMEGVLGRWTWSRDKMIKEKHKLIVKKVNGEYKLHKKVYIDDEKGRLPQSIIKSEIARTEIGSLEIRALFNDKVFNYPKSEVFLKHILEISTQENDLICDFFAGSGTTCAVAHKLNRKYIGIEMGEHFDSVVLPRIKKVIGGFKSGISKDTDFKLGGLVKYYELESYEEILRNIKYENDTKPLSYSEKYSYLVKSENDFYTLDLKALESRGVDIKETLENLSGLEVESFNERFVKFKGLDEKIEILKALKSALIW